MEPQIENPLLDGHIKIEEMMAVTKSLKTKKAAGQDLFPNEIWENLPFNALEMVQTLFNKCIDNSKVPLKWCEAIISPVFKKGDKTNPANCRPISLLPTILKFFTIILNTRLNTFLEGAENYTNLERLSKWFQKRAKL